MGTATPMGCLHRAAVGTVEFTPEDPGSIHSTNESPVVQLPLYELYVKRNKHTFDKNVACST